MAAAEKSIAQLSTLTGNYDLKILTGVVADANTRSVTQVYGNDGNVGSTTTTHTGLFLVDREGVEHAVQLVNLDVPCRPGNIISMISAEGAHNWRIAAYNHSSRRLAYADGALGHILGRRRVYYAIWGAVILLAVLVYWMSGQTLHGEADWSGLFLFVPGGWLVGGILTNIVTPLYAKARIAAFKNGAAMAKVKKALEAADLSAFPQPAGMVRTA